jgi:hypothetical protein
MFTTNTLHEVGSPEVLLSMNPLYDITFLAINLIRPLVYTCFDINNFSARNSCRDIPVLKNAYIQSKSFVPIYFEASRRIYRQKSFIYTIWQKPQKSVWFHFQTETAYPSKGYRKEILEFKYVAFYFASVGDDTIGTEWYRKHSFDSISIETRTAREDGHPEDTSLLGWRSLHIH